MSPDEYQKLAQRTECDHDRAFSRIELHHRAGGGYPRQTSTRLLHAVIGMMGELGELAGALEKWLWYGQNFDEVNFKEEIGDTNWYQAEALNALEVKFEDVLKRNIEKLKTRYPDKYTDEAALNRNLEAERSVLEAQTQMEHDFSQGYRCTKCGITLQDTCLGRSSCLPIKKGGPFDAIVNQNKKGGPYDGMDQFYDTIAREQAIPRKPFPIFNECNESGFIEPPEEVEKEEREIIRYPLNDTGMIDNQGWTFGIPTEPGDYEWFSPLYSVDPSKITTLRNYNGIPATWGRDVFYRKVKPNVMDIVSKGF